MSTLYVALYVVICVDGKRCRARIRSEQWTNVTESLLDARQAVDELDNPLNSSFARELREACAKAYETFALSAAAHKAPCGPHKVFEYARGEEIKVP